jgi:hypothetical protein
MGYAAVGGPNQETRTACRETHVWGVAGRQDPPLAVGGGLPRHIGETGAAGIPAHRLEAHHQLLGQPLALPRWSGWLYARWTLWLDPGPDWDVEKVVELLARLPVRLAG